MAFFRRKLFFYSMYAITARELEKGCAETVVLLLFVGVVLQTQSRETAGGNWTKAKVAQVSSHVQVRG